MSSQLDSGDGDGDARHKTPTFTQTDYQSYYQKNNINSNPQSNLEIKRIPPFKINKYLVFVYNEYLLLNYGLFILARRPLFSLFSPFLILYIKKSINIYYQILSKKFNVHFFSLILDPEYQNGQLFLVHFRFFGLRIEKKFKK